ncbi:MAG: hypothetical protein HND56_05815 [Pseudomonadota bacterium]|nr:hypothetical protein [Pseudomonadota bacterium]QKK05232.1 MAG: hypothetical protein HND56_05815 [Pseudomonadota bacterium]
MSRVKEIKRIENAIETRDADELQWAESYIAMRMDSIYTSSSKKMAKRGQKSWQELLDDVQSAITSISLDKNLFEQWIVSLFDHPEEDGDWRFAIDQEPLDIPEKLIPEFIIKLNHELPEITKYYTDWQLGMGLDYIYSPSCSNIAYAIEVSEAPVKTRLQAIKSMKYLYRDCLELRCQPVLGYLSETGNKLNDFCYMWWDVTTLSYYPADDPNREIFYPAVTDVMEYALTLNNIACIESGLHGLGHAVYNWPHAAEIIENFIKRAGNIDPRVMRYAEMAKTGYIN